MKYFITFDLRRTREDMFQIVEDMLNEQFPDRIADGNLRQEVLLRIRERIAEDNLELERDYKGIKQALQENYTILECTLNTSYIIETEATPEIAIPQIRIIINDIFHSVDDVVVIPLPENEAHFIIPNRN